jgi:predicted PurR-regulated permease PerM
VSIDHTAVLILLAAGATIALAMILSVVWQPIFWAVILGILFRPLMKWIAVQLPGRPSLAAALTVLAIFVFVHIPALILGSMIVAEGAALYARISDGAVDPGAAFGKLEGFFQPQIGELAARFGLDLAAITEKLQSAMMRASEFVLSLLLSAGQNAAGFFVSFFLMLYLLFFILRDGADIYGHVFRAVPLPPDQKKLFFSKFAEVSIATLKGTFIVGLAQGVLGGLIFAILGIGGAVFWGATMAIASVVPALGAALIWVPAALILIFSGAWIKGVILLAFGTFVISMADNLLRPMVVGRATQMPDYLVLFSTVGGLGVLGISGLVLGPVIAALFLVAWQLISNGDTEEDR